MLKEPIKLKEKKDFENDAEHSYQLAMVCWYLIDNLDLDLNKEKVFKYSLAHDLVEAYAGDVDSLANNNRKDIKIKKEKAEAQALDKIKNNFPNFKDLINTIETYEKGKLKRDQEVEFVYAVDKILSEINIYISKDFSYYENNKIDKKDVEEFLNYKIGYILKENNETAKFIKEIIKVTEEMFYKK